MRKKALEAQHSIPYKLVQSLSAPPTSDDSTTSNVENRSEVRVEQEVQISIENDVLKKGKFDCILVNAAVIWQSPGKLIFILEPTKAQFQQRQFKLETQLKIHHRGNIFLVDKITYSSTLHSSLPIQLTRLPLRDLTGRWHDIGKTRRKLQKSMLHTFSTLSLKKSEAEMDMCP